MPSLDSFDHSDFLGLNGIYTISYSPCEFNYQTDKIYIKIISEKDADTSYTLNINNLDNSIYETICLNNANKDISKTTLYPGLTQTFLGVAKFGGISN